MKNMNEKLLILHPFLGKNLIMAFLDEYTMLRELGRGGFATVYKVKHNQLGYVRAIRVLNELVTDTQCEIYQKFMEECRILLRLGNGNHPHIVHIYQPKLLQNKALVEMDFIDGQDLSHYLDEQKHFIPTKEVINLAIQISDALAYCHEDIYEYCMDRAEDDLQDDPEDGSKVLLDAPTIQRLVEKYRVIHNDLHSGNIIRNRRGEYILLDFGLSIEGNNVVRSSRRVNGKPEFKAPEKWDDTASLTPQSDIYSFGVVLYEYLAGRVPFVYNYQDSDMLRAEAQVRQSHVSGEVPSIFNLRKHQYEVKYSGKTYQKDYPDWLEKAIMKCLSKNPNDRFANGKELHKYVMDHCREMETKPKVEFQQVQVPQPKPQPQPEPVQAPILTPKSDPVQVPEPDPEPMDMELSPISIIISEEENMYGTMTDEDGTVYRTIRIGIQTWMVDNYRSVKFPSVAPPLVNMPQGFSSFETLGRLYTYEAARLARPSGWRLPNMADWNILNRFLQTHPEYWANENSNCIAKALASSEGWRRNNNPFTPGNLPYTNNTTGFEALPAGYYHHQDFFELGETACFWLDSLRDTESAYAISIRYDHSRVLLNDYDFSHAFSVRFIKD